jgi:hydroxymethylpyrimidine kinase/phosphomethylpyrimidine kinase
MQTALTIAGSDPTGGAGFQADLKTFQALGVYGTSVPAVLTAQNTGGVSDIHELPPDFFSSQIDMLLKDVQPDALKTGMLFTLDNVKIVAEKVSEYSLKNLVVDPVTVSSTGVSLAGDGVLEAMKQYLFPLAMTITPNVFEASVLTGIEIQNDKDVKDAAVKLKSFGSETVIVTGGHLDRNAEDMLFDGKEFLTLENEKLEGNFHGTGCIFSAVITACLADGYTIKESFIRAKEFVYSAMRSAHYIGKGMKILRL